MLRRPNRLQCEPVSVPGPLSSARPQGTTHAAETSLAYRAPRQLLWPPPSVPHAAVAQLGARARPAHLTTNLWAPSRFSASSFLLADVEITVTCERSGEETGQSAGRGSQPGSRPPNRTHGAQPHTVEPSHSTVKPPRLLPPALQFDSRRGKVGSRHMGACLGPPIIRAGGAPRSSAHLAAKGLAPLDGHVAQAAQAHHANLHAGLVLRASRIARVSAPGRPAN